MQKIAVAGAGYVGLSIACLLASQNDVVLVDIVEEKVEEVNRGISPIKDEDISEHLASGQLHLRATTDPKDAYQDAAVVIVAVPTNYDEESGHFDTSLVEDVVALALDSNPSTLVVVKSTVPVGFTEMIASRHQEHRIIFSPEFLREGKALHDNLHPSRIIAGYPMGACATEDDAAMFARLLSEAALDQDIPTLTMSSTEAEAVKLFANAYLATRVAFFNELDIYAETKGLDALSLIEGVTLDPRIGVHYCNPSFGYGGYCLPKDTKQLVAEFEGVPQLVVSAVVSSNEMRKEFIADRVEQQLLLQGKQRGVIGAYRQVMKHGSDNFRSSAIQGVIARLVQHGHDVVIYEPNLSGAEYDGLKVIGDLDDFKEACDVIMANRLDPCLEDVSSKVYSRDCMKGC